MMSYRDLHTQISPAVSVAADTFRTTSTNGSSVDLLGYRSNAVVVTYGAVTDGTHTPKIQVSQDGSTGWTDAPAADVRGTFVAGATGTANTVTKASYIGKVRYVRVVVTVTGLPATGGKYAALVVRGNAAKEPVA